MKKMLKNKTNGITLIALVVTIVVLLILAAVSISMLGGENGIIKQVQKSKKETNRSEFEEKVDLLNTDYLSNFIIDSQNAYSKLIKEISDYGYGYETNEKIVTIYSNSNKTGYTKDIELKEIIFEQVIDINPGDITKNPVTGESLDGSETTPYIIASIEDLLGFAYKVNSEGNMYKNQYVALNTTLSFKNRNSYVNADRTNLVVDDVTIWGGESQTYTLIQCMVGEDNGNGWVPIGCDALYDETKAHDFRGNFEGNNHSILDMYLYSESEFVGFFGSGTDMSVKNLNLTGKILYKNNVDKNIKPTIGGMIGFACGAYISNCNVNVDIEADSISDFICVGGIAGWIKGACPNKNGEIIISSKNYGKIEIQGNGSNTMSIGGIIGFSQGGIIRSINYGDIIALLSDGTKIRLDLGGIVGYDEYGFDEADIYGCENFGNLNVESLYNTSTIDTITVGGIIGFQLDDKSQICNLVNEGNIDINDISNKCNDIFIGGLIGELYSSNVKNSYNIGKISINNCQLKEIQESNIGSIIGLLHNVESNILVNTYSSGNININNSDGIQYIGGIVGMIEENAETAIQSSYYAGNIIINNSNVEFFGGLVGKNSALGIVENCYFLKNENINKDLRAVAVEENTITNCGYKDTPNQLYNIEFLTNTLRWDSSTWNIGGDGHPTLIL